MSKNLFSKLALGTVQFGLNYGISNEKGQTSMEEVEKILELASQNDITVLDTAHLYGESEAVLGKQKNLDRFKLVSKFPEVKDSEDLKRFFQKSLARLDTDSLYGYIAHRPDVLLKNPSIWESLVRLKQEGLVQKIGYSVYTPSEVDELINRGYHPDLIQVPFSFLDQRFCSSLEVLHQSGTEVHTRSTFLQGLFFTENERLHSFFDPIKPWLRDLAVAFPEINDRAAALLKYCLNRPFIDKVVMGVNSSTQLKSNLLNLNAEATRPLPEIIRSTELGDIVNPSAWPQN